MNRRGFLKFLAAIKGTPITANGGNGGDHRA
jgi:hypothetical protein